MTQITWPELLELAKEKGIDAVQLRWMIDIFKPESNNKIEVPVSEDVEKAAEYHFKDHLFSDNPIINLNMKKKCENYFKAGAEWQKQQDEKAAAQIQGGYIHEIDSVRLINNALGDRVRELESTLIEDGRIEKAIAWCDEQFKHNKSLNEDDDLPYFRGKMASFSEVKIFLQYM